jgi:hypothetical protein
MRKSKLRVYNERPEPSTGLNLVPTCHDRCRHHDGKRCALLGLRAHEGLPCEPAVAEMAAELLEHDELHTARPLDEWHEDEGLMLWWRFPIDEPPYVGSPLDDDWPGYHTHWSPIPGVMPAKVKP